MNLITFKRLNSVSSSVTMMDSTMDGFNIESSRKHDVSLEENSFYDHQNKCRFCFESFGENSVKIVINFNHRNSFNELTGIELLMDPGYSRHLCLKCVCELQKCQKFIKKSSDLQKQFYDFISDNPIKCENDELEDNLSVSVFLRFLPEVSIHPISNDRIIVTRKFTVKLKRVELDEFDVDMRYYEDDITMIDLSDQYYKNDTEFTNYDDFDRNDNSDSESEKSHKSDTSSNNSFFNQPARISSGIPKVLQRLPNLPYEKRLMYCDKCEYKSVVRHNLIDHVHTHIDSVKSLCPFCGKTMSSKKNLTKHIRRYHKHPHKPSIPCWVCNTEFDTNYKLDLHLRWYHPNEAKKFQCEKCAGNFFTEASLKRHDQLVHNAKVKCKEPNCNKMFFNNKIMLKHYNKHKDVKNSDIPCDLCGNTYSNHDALRLHKKRIHAESKRIVMCNICHAEYTTSLGLRNHLARHTKSAPDIKCNECDKMFYTLQEMRTHSDSMHVYRGLTCEYCGKVFQRKHHMREHIKCFHLNVNLKLPCRICQKQFATEGKLANHMHNSHKDMPCNECGEIFSNGSKLKRHQQTKHLNLRFRCVVPGCGKEYMTKGKVYDHFKKHDLTPEERELYEGLRKKLQAT